MGYQMRGSRVRGRRRKYRVGARTVNFASLGLVASALVVVVEITAPSSAPPGRLRVRRPGGSWCLTRSPPRYHRSGGGTGTRPPGLARRSGSDIADIDIAVASSVETGRRRCRIRQRSLTREVLTSAVPAALQRSHSAAQAAKRSPANVGSRTPRQRRRQQLRQWHLATAPLLAQVAVVAASSGPDLSPNVTVGVGNGNGANGAIGHGNGPSLKSQATAPAQPSPPVSSHGIGASAPPGHGAGAGHRSH